MPFCTGLVSIPAIPPHYRVQTATLFDLQKVGPGGPPGVFLEGVTGVLLEASVPSLAKLWNPGVLVPDLQARALAQSLDIGAFHVCLEFFFSHQIFFEHVTRRVCSSWSHVQVLKLWDGVYSGHLPLPNAPTHTTLDSYCWRSGIGSVVFRN